MVGKLINQESRGLPTIALVAGAPGWVSRVGLALTELHATLWRLLSHVLWEALPDTDTGIPSLSSLLGLITYWQQMEWLTHQNWVTWMINMLLSSAGLKLAFPRREMDLTADAKCPVAESQLSRLDWSVSLIFCQTNCILPITIHCVIHMHFPQFHQQQGNPANQLPLWGKLDQCR